MTLDHGISGWAWWNSAEILRAASPTISIPRSTASCVLRSRRYESTLSPATSWRIVWAASSMSHRYARSRSSGGKDHLLLPEDRLAPERIAQAFLLDEIDLAAEDLLQLVAHLDQIQKAPGRIRGEGHEDVDVAVRTKIVPQDRTEKRE